MRQSFRPVDMSEACLPTSVRGLACSLTWFWTKAMGVIHPTCKCIIVCEDKMRESGVAEPP